MNIISENPQLSAVAAILTSCFIVGSTTRDGQNLSYDILTATQKLSEQQAQVFSQLGRTSQTEESLKSIYSRMKNFFGQAAELVNNNIAARKNPTAYFQKPIWISGFLLSAIVAPICLGALLIKKFAAEEHK